MKFYSERTVKVHRGGRGITTFCLTSVLEEGVGGQHMPLQLYPWERGTVSTVLEAWWAPGLVGTGAENLAHARIRSCHGLVCSELL